MCARRWAKIATALVLLALVAACSEDRLPVPHQAGIQLTPVITWSVDTSQWQLHAPVGGQPPPAPPVSWFANYYEPMLDDPNGWASASAGYGKPPARHLTFQYVENSQQAVIVIRPRLFIPPSECRGESGSVVDGCTLVRGPRSCDIWLVSNTPGFSSSPITPEGTVNHEVGHCLGYAHDITGIMSNPRSPDMVAPSQRLLNDLHKRLSSA